MTAQLQTQVRVEALRLGLTQRERLNCGGEICYTMVANNYGFNWFAAYTFRLKTPDTCHTVYIKRPGAANLALQSMPGTRTGMKSSSPSSRKALRRTRLEFLGDSAGV